MMRFWPPSAKFFQDLLSFDECQLERARRAGCPRCGGRLDRADFPRKPRGLPAPWESAFAKRFSLCCSREGCRARCTPASVRFLGRRVYAGAVVIVASIAWLVGVPVDVARRTARRWTTWWTTTFVRTALWRVECSRFMPPVDDAGMPATLFDRFAAYGTDQEMALSRLLAFVSPVTSASASFSRDGP